MKISELVTHLSKFDPETEVFLGFDGLSVISEEFLIAKVGGQVDRKVGADLSPGVYLADCDEQEFRYLMEGNEFDLLHDGEQHVQE